MPPSRLTTIVKELRAVTAKLDQNRVQGAARLELLRRQASLGDSRDAALDAERRPPEAPR